MSSNPTSESDQESPKFVDALKVNQFDLQYEIRFYSNTM